MPSAEGGGGDAKRGWAELENLLRTLDKSSNRLDSLESIREAVKANGCLPEAPLRTRLIRAASICASDPNSRIASKWLQVLMLQHMHTHTPATSYGPGTVQRAV